MLINTKSKKYNFPNALQASQSEARIKRVLLHTIVEKTMSRRPISELLAEGAAIYGIDDSYFIEDSKIETAFYEIREAIKQIEEFMLDPANDGNKSPLE